MIILYIIGQKGYSTLVEIFKIYGKDVIKHVIVGNDNGVDNDYSSEIKYFCKKNDILFYERLSYKNNENNFYKIAIGWKWIINDVDKLIVFHDSLLPKYRGFCPLVNMLLNKETYIGVTALFASDDYDCGPIIGQEKINITYPIKIIDAIDIVSSLYQKLAIDIVSKIITFDNIPQLIQNESEATYSLWRDEDDYQIDWTQSAEWISRFIDSVSKPFKGAKSSVNGNEIRIFDATIFNKDVIIKNREKHIGKIIFIKDNKPIVICGDGLLQINESSMSVNFRTRFR